jgi:hypothetical protein
MKPSPRFVIPIAGLALAFGAVVWPRWLEPQRRDTCARPDVLSVTGLIPDSQPHGERRESLDAERIQWSEGFVADPLLPRDPLVFRMVRSYSVLKTAEHPLGLMPVRVEPETVRIELVETPEGPLPVHVVRSSGRDAFQIVAYAFVFGNDPIAQPFLAQLRGAFRELRDGRRPLTVLLAGGGATPASATHREAIALRWVAAAWQHYRGLCVDGAARRSEHAERDAGSAP